MSASAAAEEGEFDEAEEGSEALPLPFVWQDSRVDRNFPLGTLTFAAGSATQIIFVAKLEGQVLAAVPFSSWYRRRNQRLLPPGPDQSHQCRGGNGRVRRPNGLAARREFEAVDGVPSRRPSYRSCLFDCGGGGGVERRSTDLYSGWLQSSLAGCSGFSRCRPGPLCFLHSPGGGFSFGGSWTGCSSRRGGSRSMVFATFPLECSSSRQPWTLRRRGFRLCSSEAGILCPANLLPV